MQYLKHIENYFFISNSNITGQPTFYLATLQYEMFRKCVGVLLVVSMTER